MQSKDKLEHTQKS